MTGTGKNRGDIPALAGTGLDGAKAVYLYVGHDIPGDAAVILQTVFTSEQGQCRIMTHFGLQVMHIVCRQIRRVGYDPVIGSRRH